MRSSITCVSCLSYFAQKHVQRPRAFGVVRRFLMGAPSKLCKVMTDFFIEYFPLAFA